MTEAGDRLRVFISHTSKDQSIARELYLQLIQIGWLDVWFVETDLKLEQNWEQEIRAAIQKADVVVALISKNSFKREVYFYPDPVFVFDLIETKPKENRFILPVIMGNFGIPKELKINALDFSRKNKRPHVARQLIAELKKYAIKHGFPLDADVALRDTEPVLQWTPTLWKEFGGGGVFAEDPLEDNISQSASIHQSLRRWTGFENGLKRARYVLLMLVVLSIGVPAGLLLNFVNSGGSAESVGGQAVVQALTLSSLLTPSVQKSPLPTSTLGLGDVRVSDVDNAHMIFIPAGKFAMGSNESRREQPIHTVYLDSYWIDQFEVTNRRYARCVDAEVCSPPSFTEYYDDPLLANHPVVFVSWDDAKTYCEWTERRLPTEAEWEKAARGTDQRTYPWVDEVITCKLANFIYACGNGATVPVGSYPSGASPYGVRDVAGNVWEWVGDWYAEEYYRTSPSVNPKGPESGEHRVLRGGSWNNNKDYARSAYRWRNHPDYSSDFIGFRCADSVDLPTEQTIPSPAPPNEIATQVSTIDGMTMVYVPSGEFIMGSDAYSVNEKPAHIVALNVFWIDQYEITNEMYAICINKGICSPPSENSSRLREDYFVNDEFSDFPVINVSWANASTYCNWAGRRLPTEAEWEKAARGVDGRTYPWGERIDCQMANFLVGGSLCLGDTMRVRSFQIGISPYGAYDMAGNVSEWVHDWYDAAYFMDSPVTNPVGPQTGTYRVVKGGSAASFYTGVRVTSRFPTLPQVTSNFLGFRCAMDASP